MCYQLSHLFVTYLQNAKKDSVILNLHSELDATQQEFENVIEELGQKTEENEKLMSGLNDLNEQHHNLQITSDESSKKVIKYCNST